MSLTIKERPRSREFSDGDQSSVETQWVIGVTSDEAEVYALMANTLPVTAVMGGQALVLQTIEAEPLGGGWWHGAGHYGRFKRKEPPQTGDSAYNFDISAGSTRITNSLSTIGKHAPEGETAPDFKGAINVTKDGVDGVDIHLPTYTFGETHYLSVDAVTDAYKAALFAATGTVNSAAFREFAAGECLFLGASGSQRGADDWEISFKFAASPNATDLQIGSITVPTKRGWDYLWVYYRDHEDENSKSIVKRPVAAYVEQVYRYSDFCTLGV